MLSPLELKRVVLETLEIHASQKWEPSAATTTSEDYVFGLDAVEVLQREDTLDFRITLGFRLRAVKDAVCRFEKVRVRLVGYFSLPTGTDESLVNTLVPLNCLAIMFGIARGIVGQATGFVPGGPLLLPPVNFVDEMQKQERRRSRAAARAAAMRDT